MYDFSKNHFEMFGLPVGFLVDTTALAERYRDLQRVVHPDRFASGSPQERRLSLQRATQINTAFEILKDPQRRAVYLLELLGAGQQAGGARTTTDTAFLMQQMELRESLAEIPSLPNPHAQLESLLKQIGTAIKSTIAQLAVQFEDGSPEQLAEANVAVLKLQFLNKVHAEAVELETELEETI